MLREVAYRYVCIPHVPGFWDHVLVGRCPMPQMVKMIGPDDHLPKLFNVDSGAYRFHWCCFVLKKQIILAMWCTLLTGEGQCKVLPLTDDHLRNITSTLTFRRMVFYLSRWFTAQYVLPNERELKVVLDCKPSEGCLVHIMALLASKIGMEKMTPELLLSQQRVNYEVNNLRNANNMFTFPSDNTLGVESSVNIVEEFNFYHNGVGCGLSHIYTATETEFFSYF